LYLENAKLVFFLIYTWFVPILVQRYRILLRFINSGPECKALMNGILFVIVGQWLGYLPCICIIYRWNDAVVWRNPIIFVL